MIRQTPALLLLPILLGATGTAWAQAPSILTFSAHPELRRITTEISVRPIPGKAPRHYRFVKTVRPDGGKTASTHSTDSRRCPGARNLLVEVQALEMPRPHVRGLDPQDDIGIVLDGTTYRLEAWAGKPYTSRGKLSLQSSDGTPLARWVQKALATLAPCWTDGPAQ